MVFIGNYYVGQIEFFRHVCCAPYTTCDQVWYSTGRSSLLSQLNTIPAGWGSVLFRCPD